MSPGVVDVACLDTGDLNDYTCIGDPTVSANLSDLIGAVLLEQIPANTTPQRIIVAGRIAVNADYTFAVGSEIVFTEDGYFQMSTLNELTLKGVDVSACDHVMFNKFRVFNGAKLTVVDNTIFHGLQDETIRVSNNGSISIRDSKFEDCRTCLLIGDKFNINPTAV